jgi:hypothetical protein
MLTKILDEIESAGSGLNLDELARRLEVEPSALEGMIDHLVRRGKLQDDDGAASAAESAAADGPACEESSCGGCCPGPDHCPFATKLPRTLSLVPDDS